MRAVSFIQSLRDDDLLRVVDPSTGGTISSVPITLAGKIVSEGTALPPTRSPDSSSRCSHWTVNRDDNW